MKRGEVWTVAGGSTYTTKPRPALIVQSDVYRHLWSVTVCGLTSDVEDQATFRPVIAPDPSTGLRIASQIMIDKVTTVPQDRLGRKIGHLAALDMARVDQALLTFLGLAD